VLSIAVCHAGSVSSIDTKSKSYYCRDSSGMTKAVGRQFYDLVFSVFPNSVFPIQLSSPVCHAGSVSSIDTKTKSYCYRDSFGMTKSVGSFMT